MGKNHKSSSKDGNKTVSQPAVNPRQPEERTETTIGPTIPRISKTDKDKMAKDNRAKKTGAAESVRAESRRIMRKLYYPYDDFQPNKKSAG